MNIPHHRVAPSPFLLVAMASCGRSLSGLLLCSLLRGTIGGAQLSLIAKANHGRGPSWLLSWPIDIAFIRKEYGLWLHPTSLSQEEIRVNFMSNLLSSRRNRGWCRARPPCLSSLSTKALFTLTIHFFIHLRMTRLIISIRSLVQGWANELNFSWTL